jgi:hypothetical protein
LISILTGQNNYKQQDVKGNRGVHEVRMKLDVIYFDNSPGRVESDELEPLIQRRTVTAFRRSDGWVRVGRDPVRGRGGLYRGPERRGRMSLSL